jgi:hypothetical protein
MNINGTCSISLKEIARIANIQNVSAFWDMTPSSPSNTNLHFDGTYGLHSEGLRKRQKGNLQKQVAKYGDNTSPETSGYLRTTWHCNQEDPIFRSYSNEDLKYKVYHNVFIYRVFHDFRA